MIKGLLTGVAVLVLGFGGWYIYAQNQEDEPLITSYEECTAAGYPIMEIYPEQCAVPGGKSFTRILSKEEQSQLIQPGEGVAPPENLEKPRSLLSEYIQVVP